MHPVRLKISAAIYKARQPAGAMSSKTHIFKRSERAADSSFKKMQMVPQTWNKSMSLWVIRDGVEPAASPAMSASLIGHSGSSTFRLSPSAVSMSVAGSCFSSESALGPFHRGIRGRGGTIYTAALPLKNGRSKRTCELTSSIVPRGTSFHRSVEALVFSYRVLS